MNAEFLEDYFQYTGKKWQGGKDWLRVLSSISLKIVFLGRQYQNSKYKLQGKI